jgi:hypothetical protein
MPADGIESTHVIELVLLPGRDQTSDINLLSYPWICHEMAHNLFFRHADKFPVAVAERLRERVNSLRLSAIADRGPSQSRAQQARDDFSRYWTPSMDHRNWSHELAMDVVGVWVLGPAYLAAFTDLLEDFQLNPYQISPVHPPYAIRLSALRAAAEFCGLGQYTVELDRLEASWLDSDWRPQRTNQFLFLADGGLINASVASALNECRLLELKQCSPAKILELQAALRSGDTPDLGTDLLILAWLAFSEKGEADYSQWEELTVNALCNSITL